MGLLMVFVLLGLSGCGKKPVEPNLAAESFINSFIYDERSEGMEEGFIESKGYEKLFKKESDTVRKNLGSLVPFSTDLKIGEGSQTIYYAYLKALKEKTSYTVTVDELTETDASLTISVIGLDYKSIISPYIKEAMDQFNGDFNLFLDSATRDNILKESYIKHIESITPMEEAKEIKLKLVLDKKNSSKWRVDYSDKGNIDDLESLFLFGTLDIDGIGTEINKALEKNFFNGPKTIDPSLSGSL